MAKKISKSQLSLFIGKPVKEKKRNGKKRTVKTGIVPAYANETGEAQSGLVIGSWPDAPGLAEACNRDDLPGATAVPLVAVLPAGVGTLPREDFLAAAPTWFIP